MQHALVEQVQPRRLNWWLPLMAVALAVYLGAETWFKQGPLLTLHAVDAHSLGVGDALKFRGVVLGEVESTVVSQELDAVRLSVRLRPEAEAFCRVGSRFWIVHPELGLDRVEGLGTIVGARYITLEPGDPLGSAQYEFEALRASPAPGTLETGGISIRLLATERGGLAPGAQLAYRGVHVGTVFGVELTSDGTGVEIEAYVQPRYAQLVRESSRFWRTGGFEVNMALLKGISVELDSLRGLVVGGIAFATPDDGEPALSGTGTFGLHSEADAEWLEWRPSLSIGLEQGDSEDTSPRQWAVLRYRSGRLIRREKEQHGWLIALPGRLLGPIELLQIPSAAREGSTHLEVDHAELTLDSEPLWEGRGLLARALVTDDMAVLHAADVLFEPELQDCWIEASLGLPALSVSRARLSQEERGWRLDEDIDLGAMQNGALVRGTQTGKALGVLLMDEDQAHVVLLTKEMW